MAPKWGDDMNMKFLELYRQHQCLWDQTDELYKNKRARDAALASMVDRLNIEGFGPTEVKAKIKAFRGTYCIEVAKQQKNVQAGGEAHKPTLRWFGLMKEIMERGTVVKTSKNICMCGDSNASTNTVDDPTASTVAADLAAEEGSVPDLVKLEDPYNPDNAQLRNLLCEKHTRKRSLSPARQDHPAREKSKRSKIQVNSRGLNHYGLGNNEDEWDVYARHVATQLKRLSPAQALTAQMEINNVLTKCRFNDLYDNQQEGPPSTPEVSRSSSLSEEDEEAA